MFIGERHASAHAQLVASHGDELLGLTFGHPPFGNVPLDALKEDVLLTIEMLVGMKNVSAAIVNPAGYLRHDAGAIRAVQQGYDGHGDKTSKRTIRMAPKPKQSRFVPTHNLHRYLFLVRRSIPAVA